MYNPTEERVQSPGWRWWYFFAAPFLKGFAQAVLWALKRPRLRAFLEFAWVEVLLLGDEPNKRDKFRIWIEYWVDPA